MIENEDGWTACWEASGVGTCNHRVGWLIVGLAVVSGLQCVTHAHQHVFGCGRWWVLLSFTNKKSAFVILELPAGIIDNLVSSH